MSSRPLSSTTCGTPAAQVVSQITIRVASGALTSSVSLLPMTTTNVAATVR